MDSKSLDADPLPSQLIGEISNGNVVAFVGAGFSRAACMPLWGELIESVVRNPPKGAKLPSPAEMKLILRLAQSSSAQDLDMAAQMASDSLGESHFNEGLRARLKVTKVNSLMQKRLDMLLSIPFSGIVTTNYDNLLHGSSLDSDPRGFLQKAQRMLRGTPSKFKLLEEIAFKSSSEQISIPVIKLHGDAEQPNSILVCTRQGYRRLLHKSPQYSAFMRTLLATKTILFLGFSFTDAYLSELISEVMSMFTLDVGELEKPLAYAIMADVDPVQQKFSRRHDGVEIISFNSSSEKGFGHFDDYLTQIHSATNPEHYFGRTLHERRIIWVHADWESSRDSKYLCNFLGTANLKAMGKITTTLAVATSAYELIKALSVKEFDCVIIVYDGGGIQVGEKLSLKCLREMRKLSDSPPVLVFGARDKDGQKSRTVMRLGARVYTEYYYSLLENLAFVLEHTCTK